jgi:hypothetical protein
MRPRGHPLTLTRGTCSARVPNCGEVSRRQRGVNHRLSPREYARLITLNPVNNWDHSAFFNCDVCLARTSQQRDGNGCGPATAATLHHLVRTEPLEPAVEGDCLQFAHLVLIYNTVHGPCPFSIGVDGRPYVLPIQKPFIDPDVLQLLDGSKDIAPTLKGFNRSKFIKARGPKSKGSTLPQSRVSKSKGATLPKSSKPKGPTSEGSKFNAPTIQDQPLLPCLSLRSAEECIDEIMARYDRDHSTRACGSIDVMVVLWNILLRHGAAALQPHNIERLRAVMPKEWISPDATRSECLQTIRSRTVHFGLPQGIFDDTANGVPIAGGSGVRSLALLYLSGWLENKFERSVPYEEWCVDVMASHLTLVVPMVGTASLTLTTVAP